MSTTDTCAACSGDHRSNLCNIKDRLHCVSCRSNDHASSDRKCPEFVRRCKTLDSHTPENDMPYFPMEELWTQVLSPASPLPAIVPTCAPLPQRQEPTLGNIVVNQQQTQRKHQPSQGCSCGSCSRGTCEIPSNMFGHEPLPHVPSTTNTPTPASLPTQLYSYAGLPITTNPSLLGPTPPSTAPIKIMLDNSFTPANPPIHPAL
jgi:hypothetical protein